MRVKAGIAMIAMLGFGVVGYEIKAEPYTDLVQYKYDGLNRLQSATTGTGQAQSFSHDEVHNRITEVRQVAPEDAPVAKSDVFSLIENTALTVNAASGVLSNDDFGTEIVSAVSITQPLFGALVLATDGSFTYTPQAGFFGRDEFAYQINSIDTGFNSNIVRVILTVDADSLVPVAKPDELLVPENTPTDLDVIFNDENIDTVISVGNAFHGQVEVINNLLVRYTPNTDYQGQDVFSYLASGPEGTSSARVTISINPQNKAPVTSIAFAQTTANQSVAIPLLDFVEDKDGDDLQIISVSAASKGLLDTSVYPITYLPGTFVADTNKDYMSEVLTYVVSDGVNPDVSNSLLIYTYENVQPVAMDDCFDAALSPECVSNSEYEVLPEQTTLLNVLSNDFDVAGEPISIDSILVEPLLGDVVINNNLIEYTADVGQFDQTDSFTYQITDGTSAPESATVFLKILPDDNSGTQPVAVDDCFLSSASPGCGVSSSLILDYEGSVSIDVLANDTDPNGETLNVIQVSPSSEGATLSQSGNTLIYNAPGNGPVEGFNDSFTYVVENAISEQTAQATVYLRVRSEVNNPPVGNTDNVIVFFNEARDLKLTTNDTDEDFDSISIVQGSLTTPAPSGTVQYIDSKTVRYTPAFNQQDPATFQYQITDGKGAPSALITVNIEIKDKFLLVPLLKLLLLEEDTQPAP